MDERKFGLVNFVLGLAMMLTGYGMLRRPHPDWGALIQDVSNLADLIESEAIRLTGDPFAALGVVVMFGGLALIYEASKRFSPERERAEREKRT